MCLSCAPSRTAIYVALFAMTHLYVYRLGFQHGNDIRYSTQESLRAMKEFAELVRPQ